MAYSNSKNSGIQRCAPASHLQVQPTSRSIPSSGKPSKNSGIQKRGSAEHLSMPSHANKSGVKAKF
jgi:hypothetical protein